MTFLYIVRCRFTEPAREQAWNDWYSGPKIAQMLAKPYFRTCQRFRRSAGVGRDYLALWTLQSPEAFTSREYTTDWGFAEWASHITDWSRDLFDGGDAREEIFAVPPQGALHVVSFDGMSDEDAHRTRGAMAALRWLPVIGLDRHTPAIGLEVLHDQADAALPPGTDGAQEAIYRPICNVVTANARP